MTSAGLATGQNAIPQSRCHSTEHHDQGIALGKPHATFDHAHLFLDTSAYLHYRNFAEVDWPRIVSAPTVTLVVPSQVIRELDKQKDHHRSRTTRDRARRILARLKELHALGPEAQVRDGVYLQYERQPPAPHAFETYGLDRNIPDEYILAVICTFKERNPDADVVLIARDTTMQWTGAELGLRVVEAPKGIELEDEPDALEKENRDLKRELLALKARFPVLSVSFSDAETIWRPIVEVAPPLPVSSLSAEVWAVVEKEFPPAHQLDVSEMSAKWMRSELDRYDRERREYSDDFVAYIKLFHAWEEHRSRTLKLPLILSNDGMAPAVDVTLELVFPAQIQVTVPTDEPRPPSEPEKPKFPSRLVISGNRRTRFKNSFGLSDREREEASGYRMPDIWGPHFSTNADDSTRVVEEFKKIQQADRIDVGPLLVVFESYEDVRPFGIVYVLRADDIPPQEGELHVVPKVSEQIAQSE